MVTWGSGNGLQKAGSRMGAQGTGRALVSRWHLPPSMSSVQLRLLLVGELEEV